MLAITRVSRLIASIRLADMISLLGGGKNQLDRSAPMARNPTIFFQGARKEYPSRRAQRRSSG